MRKIALLSAIVVLATAWMLAQTSASPESTSPQSSTTTSQSTTTTSTSNNPNSTSLTGCLQGSSGNFSLVASNGQTYQLQGSQNQLGQHIGQEVSIMGSMPAASAAASTQGGMTGTTSAENQSSTGNGSMSNPSSNQAGTSSSGMSNTSPAAATGNAGVIEVTSVSKVSDTCTAKK